MDKTRDSKQTTHQIALRIVQESLSIFAAWAGAEIQHQPVEIDSTSMVAIAINLIAALRNQVRGSACRVLASDAKVSITEQGPFFYPDVLVTCDERDRRAIQFVQFPCLIVEVLSQTTEAYDCRAKFSQYRRLESLCEYVLISSELVLSK